MKKYAIVALLVLSIVLLASCSSNSQPTQTATASEAATASDQNGYPATSAQQQQTGYPAGQQPTQQPITSSSYPAQGTDANLRIIKGDGTVIKSISLSDLNTFSKVNVGDKSGAKLTDLLDWAGVLSTYSKVTIVSASGSVQLTKDKVTDQTILIVENNSVSFASQSVPTDQWLNGVTDIKVE